MKKITVLLGTAAAALSLSGLLGIHTMASWDWAGSTAKSWDWAAATDDCWDWAASTDDSWDWAASTDDSWDWAAPDQATAAPDA